MKSIMFLGLISVMLSTAAFSQSYYEEDYPAYEEPMLSDEGSFNSELQPPLTEEYYYSDEELERQEEYPEEYSAETDWSLEGEEIPVEDFETSY